MQQEQIKKIIVNGLAILVIVGVVVTGYSSFTGGKTENITTPEVSAVGQVADETRLIGAEIDRTVRELRGLDSALESSVAIFDLPAFMNLQDFSVSISEEPVGRDNPFIPTLWKTQMKALEGSEQKSSASPRSVQSAPVTRFIEVSEQKSSASSRSISSAPVGQPEPAFTTEPQPSSDIPLMMAGGLEQNGSASSGSILSPPVGQPEPVFPTEPQLPSIPLPDINPGI